MRCYIIKTFACFIAAMSILYIRCENLPILIENCKNTFILAFRLFCFSFSLTKNSFQGEEFFFSLFLRTFSVFSFKPKIKGKKKDDKIRREIENK